MGDYKPHFIRSIKDNFPGQSDHIIQLIDTHYENIAKDTKFAFTSGNPIDRRLDFSAYFLALIKTLHEKGETFEGIRRLCLEIVTNYVKPGNRLHAYSKRLLPKLTHTWVGKLLIKKLNDRTSRNSNRDGFVANIITDKNETFGLGYGIDILECGICKLFKKHRYEQYARILCEVDEITSGLAGLTLIRTGTIANGAKKCDFRFKKRER